eukprot:s2_g67.t1
MFQLSHFDFKQKENKLPMTRAALLCTILTSKKHADGISKLVYKADLDKMKGTLKEKTLKMESLLKQGWNQVQQSSCTSALKALCFGKFCVRLVLHLLSKEKHSRDQPFESVQSIVDQFAVDLLDPNLKAASSGAAPAPKAQESQSSAEEVKDLLNATPKAMAQLDNPHLMLDASYVNPSLHEDKVFRLKSWTDTGVEFVHTPLFGAEETEMCDFTKLNAWKLTKRGMPKKCTQDMALLKAVHTSETFKADLKKAEVQSLLLKAYKDHLDTVHKSLIFAHVPSPALFCDVKVKKGGLTLFPVGTIQSLKGKDMQKVKGVVVEYQQEQFLVQPYKGFKDFDDESADGVLIPYNFEEDVTMVSKMVTYEGLKIPVLTNDKALAKEIQLLKAEPDDGQPAAEPPEEAGPFEKWLEAGCSPSALDGAWTAAEEPEAGHDVDPQEWEEVLDEEDLEHYGSYYQAHYWTAADGSSHQLSEERVDYCFICKVFQNLPLQDWPQKTEQDYGTGQAWQPSGETWTYDQIVGYGQWTDSDGDQRDGYGTWDEWSQEVKEEIQQDHGTAPVDYSQHAATFEDMI